MSDPSASHPLRATTRPKFEEGARALRLVDLFSGCGGLTLGAAQAARAMGARLEVALAVDFEPLATAVYRRNFPNAARVETAAVEEFFDGRIGQTRTLVEARTAQDAGEVDVLVGGPPCQGHSNLNNHTRRVDNKNALYLRMVRAAEVLYPRAVLIENVPAVLNDRHDGEGVVTQATSALAALGYDVAHRVVEMSQLGVAQTRKRHILVGLMGPEGAATSVLDGIQRAGVRDLRWAIGDLVDISATDLLNQAPKASAENLKRMDYLLRNDQYDLPNELRPVCHQSDHSYKSMYGRLRWDRPAQTITSGYGSIGQGRYMHPERRRALTGHEAARIQGFPDYFDFSDCPTRTALATMIGNAVPPALAASLVTSYLKWATPVEHQSEHRGAEAG